MSKNFEFLMVEVDTAVLFETANLAEQNYTNKDYEGTLTKVRKMAENAVALILEKEAINLFNRATFSEKLNEAKLKISEPYIVDAFYEIKKLGNLAAHEINPAEATQENARTALHQIFVILVWFVKTYTDTDIKLAYMDFLEPEAEKLYQAAERKLIYIQTVNNESGMFQAFEGTHKIGEATAPDDDFEVDWSPNSEFLRTIGAKRINQYMKTAGLNFVLEWVELAWKKSTKTWFHDHDVHEVLKRSGVKKPELLDGAEWFKTDLPTAKSAIKAVKEGQSSLQIVAEQSPTYEIKLRPEQKAAVDQTKKVFNKKNSKNTVLWNAKMRFGKTLTSLQLIKDEKYQKVLIMTHRPVVSDSWFEDFGKMNMADEGYRFGSSDKGEKLETLKKSEKSFIYFTSIQKLRYDGGQANLADFSDICWDLIIIDEAHEGTQTELAEVVLKAVKKENTKVLELSGTPFNLLDLYDEDQIYTWDYTMEQTAKLKWSLENPEKPNPYESLPKVSMYTFEMRNKEKYADESKSFNFREFFRVNDDGVLAHKEDVRVFLDNITNQDSTTNYPFSTAQYRNELRHTLWLMPGVKEANAFEKLLNEHPIFGKEYKIINVVKDDNSDSTEFASEGDLHKIRHAISKDPSQTKTITLTVRKLTTGVNIPEWTAVLFLSNTNSAMNYLQAAFRAQTPFSHEKVGMKKNCYIFDFAPDRALSVMAESARVNSGVGKKNTQEQKDMLTRLLNFMPILGNSEMGMTSFNVDKMLTQLKKVYAEKAVRSGFEDDSLYNDSLLILTDSDAKMFQDLNTIVGKTQGQKQVKIIISDNGLSDEAYDKGERAKKKKAGERIPDEIEAIDKINEAKKQRKTMIAILRGVSIRIPMMIYGMKLDIVKDISITDFVKQVDDASWQEFMPKGFTKGMFKQIMQYYDAEVFIEAGRLIRQRAKSYDQLDFIARAEKISELFGTFKNPDKETVLTPWRVVNLQLTKTIGGLNFYDDEFISSTEGAVSNLHWIENPDTQQAYKSDTKVLEINTKTGLYPLHIAMSLYFKALKENQDSKFEAVEVYKQILKKNIYAIAKTPMAKTITERTLTGYKDFETNIAYIDGFVDAIKESPAKGKAKVEEVFENVKFDVVIGNPPYQESDNGSGTGSAKPLYDKFIKTAISLEPKFISLITPSVWFLGGKGLDNFRIEMLNDIHFKEITSYVTPSDVFSNVNLRGGVNFFLWSRNFDNVKSKIKIATFENGRLIDDGNRPFQLDGANDILISENKSYYLLEKLFSSKLISSQYESSDKMMYKYVSERNPFGIATTQKKFDNHSKKYYIKVYASKGRVGFVSLESIGKNQSWNEKYKVLTAFANNIGTDLSDDNLNTIISGPQSICTETFLVIGASLGLNKLSASNLSSYIKTKFVRYLISLAKANQNGTRKTYRFVPLQDFTPKSDIDWTKSSHQIDQQLYAKYGFSQDEIDFIEEKVKAME